MIWPWSEIEKWKELAKRYERQWDENRHFNKVIEAEYLKLAMAMRGAHKGIWRLRQKLKNTKRSKDETAKA